MPQLPACYNALTCRACHWQLLITSRRGDSLWKKHTHTHTHTHTRRPHTQTSLIKCAHASTNTHKPRAQVCISLHLVATRARKLRGEGKKNNKKEPPKSPHQDLDCDKTCAQIRWNLSGNNNMTAGSEAPNIKCHFYFQPWLRAVWQTIPCCFSISQPVSWKCGKLGPWMSFSPPFRKNKKWSEVQVKVKGEIIKLLEHWI